MATTMTEIPIKDLALTTAPAGKQLLVRDASAGLQRIDYDQIAKNLVESYGSSSLAGKNQSIKAAIDSLNSGLTQNASSISTINDSLSKFNGYLTRQYPGGSQYKQTMPDNTIFAVGKYEVNLRSGSPEGSLYYHDVKISIPKGLFNNSGIQFQTQVELNGGYGAYCVIGSHSETTINGQIYTNIKEINKTAKIMIFTFF